MKKSHALAVLVAAALLALGLTACGGDDEAEAGEVTTVAVTEADPAVDPAPEIPEELVGTYETERPEGNLPAGTWGMAIGPRGELFIIPPGETGFFAAPVSVDAETLVLSPDPAGGCDAEGRYTYALKGPRPGGSLTLTAADEPCPDRQWVMAQNPWTRTD